MQQVSSKLHKHTHRKQEDGGDVNVQFGASYEQDSTAKIIKTTAVVFFFLKVMVS